MHFLGQHFGQQGIELCRAHHVFKRDTLVVGVGCLFVAGTKANRGNANLTGPVSAVGRKIPGAGFSCFTPKSLNDTLPGADKVMGFIEQPGRIIFGNREDEACV